MAMSECGQKRPLPELEKIEKPRKRAKISDEPPDPADIPQLESALFYKFDNIGLGFKQIYVVYKLNFSKEKFIS